MDIEVREMTIEDHEEAFSLWRKTPAIALREIDTLPHIEKYLQRNPRLSSVAINKNKLVGVVLCGYDGHLGYIYHLAVTPEFREKGIGTSLVNRSLTQLKKLGIGRCHFFLDLDNTDAERFWKKVGGHRRDELFMMSIDLWEEGMWMIAE